MNRRDFIKTTGLGAATVASVRLASGASGLAAAAAGADELPKPIDVKVRVKPVCGYPRIHQAGYGGPCRRHRIEIVAYRLDPRFPELAEVAESFGPGVPPSERPPMEQYIPEKYNKQTELEITIQPGSGRITRDFNL